jgi:hypothetical protein
VAVVSTNAMLQLTEFVVNLGLGEGVALALAHNCITLDVLLNDLDKVDLYKPVGFVAGQLFLSQCCRMTSRTLD